MGFSTFDERVALVECQQLTSADVPGSVSMVHMVEPATRINGIFVSQNDDADLTASVVVTDVNGHSGTLATANVPAGAGYSVGVPAVDLLAGLVLANGALVLPAGCYVLVHFPSGLGLGASLDVIVLYATV